MSKHTAGPWFLETRKSTCDGVCVAWSIDTATRVGIASAQSQEHLGPTGIYEGECLANARLIAAAPDLLEALKNVVNLWDHHASAHGDGVISPMHAAARAALAKAEAQQ